MPENNVDLTELQNKIEALANKIGSVQQEMRNSKPQENINVRVVDTNQGSKIVVEHTVERWYSPKYFKKLVQSAEQAEQNNQQGYQSQGSNNVEPGDSLF